MIELCTLEADDWRPWRAVRLAALADAPSAFGARLADWQDADEARWRARFATVPFHVIALLDGRPVGQVAAAPSAATTVELLSLWVAPEGRGRGVADALIEAVVRWARARAATRVVLNVVASNDAAQACYRRNQFVPRPDLVADAPAELVMSRALV